MIAPEFLRELRDRTSLVEVIGERVRFMARGCEYVGLCPFHAERTPSFTVSEDKGFFHCFDCGMHGDALAFVRAVDGLDFRAAVEQLAVRAGLIPDARGACPQKRPLVHRPVADDLAREAAASIGWARGLWRAAEPAPGTPVETYLRTRGITLPVPASLRCARRLKHSETGLLLPAMVAAVQNARGEVVGVHRTFLADDGRGKTNVATPKKMGGVCWGGAVRFARAAETLAIAEGVETALSVAQAVPGLAVWAALSLGNLAGGGHRQGAPHPRRPDRRLPTSWPDMDRPGLVLPPVVCELILCADADNGDPESAEALLERAARRFEAHGLKIRIARPRAGTDFNDILREERHAA